MTKWQQAVDEAGLAGRGYTPKSLRHYFASMAPAAGIPLYEVSRRLGHSSTKVTEQVCAHLVEGAVARITDAFEGAMGGSGTETNGAGLLYARTRADVTRTYPASRSTGWRSAGSRTRRGPWATGGRGSA
ncbi:tyrosine-type recombinase/integrase [Streptomyces sp. DG2A-72]|nr:tyrosine-type recombinase/integrase [Streptomyces sp. DG2A-72]MDO0935013.1 tyrosine-type recombinase/integrase [Streptomyces sp. DG2A-72]